MKIVWRKIVFTRLSCLLNIWRPRKLVNKENSIVATSVSWKHFNFFRFACCFTGCLLCQLFHSVEKLSNFVLCLFFNFNFLLLSFCFNVLIVILIFLNFHFLVLLGCHLAILVLFCFCILFNASFGSTQTRTIFVNINFCDYIIIFFQHSSINYAVFNHLVPIKIQGQISPT